MPSIRGADAEDVEALILEKVGRKVNKGGALYALGKTLVVFLNAGGGEWYPDKVARQLPDPLYFAAVWVVGFQSMEVDQYVYAVTRDVSRGRSPAWRVRISKDFDAWVVEPIQ